jgi:hypothetical protein
MTRRLLNAIARWFFVNHLKPLCDDYIRAELAKAEMGKTMTPRRKEHVANAHH